MSTFQNHGKKGVRLIRTLSFAFPDRSFTTGLGLWVIAGITTFRVSLPIIYLAKAAALVILIIAGIATLLPSKSIINLVVTTGLVG